MNSNELADELKSEWYVRNFFFSLTPDEWSYEELTNYLRKQEGTFDEMDLDCESLAVWDPFEDYNPSWVADQMDMMVEQLSMLFKEVI